MALKIAAIVEVCQIVEVVQLMVQENVIHVHQAINY
jgi:hypothetical protein